VAEPHRSMLSWASPLGAPPERDTLPDVRERTSTRGARDPHEAGRSGGRVRDPGATATREGSGHTGTARGRKGRGDITATPRCPWIPTVCAATEVASSPARAARKDGRPLEPIPRRPAGSSVARPCDPPEGAQAAASEVSRFPCAAWVAIAEAIVPSARPRSVRSAVAVDGVHVADGLIRSRSVSRGRAIGAMTPASARRREVPPYVSSPRVIRSLARRIAATRCRPG